MNWWVVAGTFVLLWAVLALVLGPLARKRPDRRWLVAAAVVAALAPAVLLNAPSRPEETPAPPAVDRANDVGSRLELARTYTAQGLAEQAIDQYVAVLQLDNRNAEAYAAMGYLLHLAGRSEDGLWSVEEALRLDPSRLDAVYFRGAILAADPKRAEEGRGVLRDYLARATQGHYRADAQKLLDLAR
ncbi:tetratricopeptide repeat protein [Nocardia sp. NRRL S-836]|uniref:tetratricopeptide repeat protein n=1 Tax=Nocardia sp. NRRL S-836 TaxID=1519492 RepID=UPI0006AE2084|nr:tetratricopeptide repeat protein [Nocardia sp. NRRL S-836]KOV86330.1 hypothetical protein ADL03_09295 [Nocardia sp. NRRL S-836]